MRFQNWARASRVKKSTRRRVQGVPAEEREQREHDHDEQAEDADHQVGAVGHPYGEPLVSRGSCGCRCHAVTVFARKPCGLNGQDDHEDHVTDKD